MSLSVIILAAGFGSRMKSNHSKVLLTLANKPLLMHVIDAVEALNPQQLMIVHGHKGNYLQAAIAHPDIIWVEQQQRLGTGHAVQQCLEYLNKDNQVLILYGDVPLISSQTLKHMVDTTHHDQLGLLTAQVANPKGLGRIVRDQFHQVKAIIEEKDADDLQRQITEVNTGVYCSNTEHLSQWLPKITNKNMQQEYYLTDIVGFAIDDQIAITISQPLATEEVYGANSRSELAHLERIYQKWQVEKLMQQGVSVIDPTRVDIRGTVSSGMDTTIDVNVILEGEVKIGAHCYIGPGCQLINSTIEDYAIIKANSYIEGAKIGQHASIGPFARIREHTSIGKGAKIGNFVEVKKAQIGAGSKINHLSYVGDSVIGQEVNIGAGVITCNYDGATKHQTTLGDGCFIGSNAQLVAPVSIGEGATVAAGSTITKDVPAGRLVVARQPQKLIENWQRPQKNQKTKEKVKG